ncbi:MAG: leucine-rich repeat domain-containing protein [Selenomonadaceae bacterium]|nr:leucine-rich repeat domain-containing protein [Selenomonadaceae bacterium]
MASGKCGENLTWTLDDKGTLTIRGSGNMKDYFYFPADTKNPWVNYSIKKVIISDGVTSIGEFAFYECKSLTSITIPDSVTFIGKCAFWLCKSLTSVTIPDSVTFISESTFDFCESLTSITIPDGVTFIDAFAFRGCKSLTSITIPDSVTSIGYSAFSDCYNLTIRKPTAPPAPQPVNQLRWKVEGINLTVGGVNKIKDYSEEVPPWNDYLRDVQRVIVEDGVTEIAAHAFSNCVALEHVTIPASLETIGDFAFTFSYCGEWNVNNRKNVIWSLERGTLIIKKNPNAANETDFSIGDIAWKDIEKNIQAVRIERGIFPAKNFFDWINRMGDGVSVTF